MPRAAALSNATGRNATYVSPEGRRCDARTSLELDHIEPHALGGANDEENLRVRCRAHNQLTAEQTFGREHVALCRHFVRQKYPQDVARETLEGQAAHKEERIAPNALERVLFALSNMRVRDAVARRAVALVERKHRDAGALSVELALRDALLAATAGLH